MPTTVRTPEEVFGHHARALMAEQLEDIVADYRDDANMVFLQLRNGLHATIVHAGYRSRGVDTCEVEVTCTDGMLLFDSYSNRLAVDHDGAYAPIEVQRLEPFAEELKNLVGAINGTQTLRVSPAWGRHIVEVLLAAEESSRTGREVEIRSRVLVSS